MTIDKTTRKASLTIGSVGSGYVFDVPIAIENTSDLTVYDASGNLMRENVHYTVSGHGLPAHADNDVSVTWVGTPAAGTYTFYRTSGMTQPVDLSAGYGSGDVETIFDRATLSLQNAINSTNNVLDTLGGRIQKLASPVNDSDASTLGYAQETYSKKGLIPPGVTGVDTNKALYAESTTSIIWKDPLDVPYPTATSKILQVNGQGEPEWVNPVEYAPTFPTTEPMYLSVDGSSNTEWRTFRQLPKYEQGNVGDTCVAQFTNTFAWEPIRWFPQAPPSDSLKWIWVSTGTGTDGAVGSVTTTLNYSTKTTYIKEDAATTNFGTSTTLFFKGDSSPSSARNPIFEFDLSGLTASDYTMDTLVSVYLRLKFLSKSASANRTFAIKRMPVDFNETEITWEKPTTSGDWIWTDGGVADLDHETPVSTISIGTDVDTSDFTYVDVTQLFLDAINRRAGILRLYTYDPSPTATSVWARCASNNYGGDATYKPCLEIKNAPARVAKWQAWNYKLSQGLPGGGNLDTMPVQNDDYAMDVWQPHVVWYGHLYAEDALKNHITAQGKSVGCWYGISDNGTIGTAADDGIYGHTAVSGESVMAFQDRTYQLATSVADSLVMRASGIWMENE